MSSLIPIVLFFILFYTAAIVEAVPLTIYPVSTLSDDLQTDQSAKRDALTVQLALPADFPDPSIIQYNNTAYAFATTNGLNINVQLSSRSSTSTTWSLWSDWDALPNPGSWTTGAPSSNGWTNRQVWAPNVVQNDSGQFVMYYSASVSFAPSFHCTGIAIASTIQGPYVPYGSLPVICPLAQGGAIDASGFRDTDGSRYIVYKVDGNSIGNGGDCGNSIPPIVPTPIMLQRVAGDAMTAVGQPVQILDRDDSDGPLIEAPALVRAPGGWYVLFFSSHCYNSVDYDIMYAVASSITGPYTKYGSFAMTNTSGLFAPGGAHVDIGDDTTMVFHAGQVGSRFMYTVELEYVFER